MREIKFRAWDKREKIMGEVNYIRFFKSQYTQVSVRFKKKGKVFDDWYAYGQEDGSDNIILMQYTGLKDKNGVEIYEGDIITWLDSFGKNGVANVIYDGNLACFNTYRGELSHIAMRPNLEVIGNINDNPELLKDDVKIVGEKNVCKM